MTDSPRLRLTVDLDALASNWHLLANTATGAVCAAAVKANAYGIGLEPVTKRLARQGCTTFFVATLPEAVQLRARLSDVIIYLLDGVQSPEQVDVITLNGIIPVLNSADQIALWMQANGPCGIMVDTGINRLGIDHADAASINLSHLNVVLWLSHLASADDPASPQNALQLQRFQQSLPQDFPTPASLANSAGIFLGAPWHFDMVRPGIALYGGQAGPTASKNIRQVIRAEARVIQVRNIPAGSTVGYNATWTAQQPTRLATLGIGYADGYLRTFSNTGQVFLNGSRCPVIGRVSMDLSTIDVSAVPDVQPGDYAEVLGPNMPLSEAAAASGLSQYELLTCLGSRYERIYPE